MKQPYKVLLGVGLPILLFSIALTAAFFAPAPWKLWVAYGVLVFVSSQFVWRAIQTIAGKPCSECIPYIVATFLAIAPVMLFAPEQYSHIALIVWGVLVGAAGFYWAVAGIVHEVKRIGCKIGAWIEKKPSVTQ
jgi:hypothetical protein